MNKEELIKALEYAKTNQGFGIDISEMCSDVISVLKNCIEIPEGATSGDMIIDILPVGCIIADVGGPISVSSSVATCYFDKKWWNSKFTGESNSKVVQFVDTRKER